MPVLRKSNQPGGGAHRRCLSGRLLTFKLAGSDSVIGRTHKAAGVSSKAHRGLKKLHDSWEGMALDRNGTGEG